MVNEVPADAECPQCHGAGTRNGEVCDLCGGSGRIPVVHYPPDTDPFEQND